MAKKKKNHRKHQFQSSAPKAVNPAAFEQSGSSSVPSQRPKSSAAVATDVANIQLVKQDVRRVLVLAVGFFTLQLILWYLFNHTPLGPWTYNLIKL